MGEFFSPRRPRTESISVSQRFACTNVALLNGASTAQNCGEQAQREQLWKEHVKRKVDALLEGRRFSGRPTALGKWGEDAVGDIYFAQADSGLIKIGISKNVQQRLRSVKATQARYEHLRLLLTIPGNRAKERRLHDYFARWRARGEWFHPSAELTRFIADSGGLPPNEYWRPA